jgi:hypothetical protein
VDNPLSFSDSLGLCPDRAEVCRQLREEIRKTRNGLWDLLDDEASDAKVWKNAPNIAALGKNYVGHRTKFYNERRRLEKLMKKWDDNKCDDIDNLPPGVPELLDAEYPDLDPRRLRPYFERQRDILRQLLANPLDTVRMLEFGTMGSEWSYGY